MLARRGSRSSSVLAGTAAAILWAGLLGLSLPGRALAQEAPKPPAANAAADASQKRLAWLFRIDLPITGRTSEDLREPIRKAIETAEGEKARPVLIFEFAHSKEEADYARQTLIGSAFDLANFLSSDVVSRARTVAYLPQTVEGHAVLAVLACDEIVMAPDAELGPAVAEAGGSDLPAVVADYRAIVTRRKKFLEDVAVKLADPAQELLKVETDKGGAQYVTREHLDALKKTETLVGQPATLFAAGEPARFSGTDARRKGFIEHLAANRGDLVRTLDLSEAIRAEVQVAGSYRAKRVDIRGLIEAGMAAEVQRMIKAAIRDSDVNFICLWIDSAGGNPVESMELATFLATDPQLSTVQTVAYVPEKARADAALIALACNEIAMLSGATLGGEGDYIFSADETRMVVEGLHGPNGILSHKGRSWSVAAAMFDPRLAVYRCTRGNLTAYFCDEELAKQQEDAAREGGPGPWKKWEALAKPALARPLWLSGENAGLYLPGIRKVESRTEFLRLYNLTRDPELLEPTWVETLVGAPGLAGPGGLAADYRRGGALRGAAQPRHRHRGLCGRGLLRAVLLEPLPGPQRRVAPGLVFPDRDHLPALGGVRPSRLRDFWDWGRAVDRGLAGPGLADVHHPAQRLPGGGVPQFAAGDCRGDRGDHRRRVDDQPLAAAHAVSGPDGPPPALRRGGRGDPLQRDPGPLRGPGGDAGEDHHAAHARRQGPLRQGAVGRDDRRRVRRPQRGG